MASRDEKRDYYDVLGVGRSATADELKKAYRVLAKKYHPDLNAGDEEAEKNFKQVSEAYDCLKDEQNRAAYDQFGHAAFQGGSPGAGGASGGFNAGGFGDFSSMGDIFEEFFGGRGGGRQRRQGGPQRGNDLRYNLEIDLADVFAGKSEQISVSSAVACDSCKGSGAKAGTEASICGTCQGQGTVRSQQGFFTVERPCHSCGGEGRVIKDPCGDCQGKGHVHKERTLSFDVPRGVEDGTRIRLTGEGDAGARGGPKGDLYVFINVRPHSFLQRDGADLFCRVPMPMTMAALGGSIEVPMLDGKRIKVSVPEGAQSGQQFRLRGKGMPVLRSRQFGDLYVQLAVEVPTELSKKQKELLKQFSEATKTDSYPESEDFRSRLDD